MDIRELKRPPVFGDADTFDALVDYAERSVAETAIVQRPRNVAVLAALRATEVMVALGYKRHELEFLRLAAEGRSPHAMPVFQAEVEAKLKCLRQVLRAIYVADRPIERPIALGDTELREAGVALLRGAFAASALAFLNEAALGWRGFVVNDNRIELMHRSPERLKRRIHGAIVAEALTNARHTDGQVSTQERQFYERANALHDAGGLWDWTNADDIIAGALAPATRAGEELYRWEIDATVAVGNPARFTVGDFRRVAEVVKAVATVGELVGDGVGTVGSARVLQGTRSNWIQLLARHSSLAVETVAAILSYMTRLASDEPRGRPEGRPATTNPFFDLGDDELALSVTCSIWQNPTWALLATWTRRDPDNFGAAMNERGHALASEVHAMFKNRGWTSVLERSVPNSDLDVATAVQNDEFMIVVEAKAFLYDPTHQVEDPKAWTQLADNVDRLRDPDQFRRIFQNEKLSPSEIAGLVVIPGYGTPATEQGDAFGSLGVEDLRSLVAQATSPRDLWRRIKETEVLGTFPLRTEELELGPWRLVFDVGDREALPQAVRVENG
jgi:hypothetical protein